MNELCERIQILLSPETKKWLEARKELEDRSLSGLVRWLIARYKREVEAQESGIYIVEVEAGISDTYTSIIGDQQVEDVLAEIEAEQ